MKYWTTTEIELYYKYYESNVLLCNSSSLQLASIEDLCKLYIMNIRVVYAPNAVDIFLVAGGTCEFMNFPNFQQSLGDSNEIFFCVWDKIQRIVKENKN